ncbi:MAG TPA: hypothetical protein VGO47_06290 [Chlamydiales bacterium]|jgi:hypothetical protein|nr:hypothetical protein [Chlamydiales bacterium]
MLDALWSDIYFSGFWASPNYAPEDIRKMRRAFSATYAEQYQSLQTEAQRHALAQAIIMNYSPLQSEGQLAAAAWGVMVSPDAP